MGRLSVIRRVFNSAALCGIAAVSIALNADGIRFGMPHYVIYDEFRIVGPAFHIIKTGSLNPHAFTYPSLYIYFIACLFSAVFLALVLTGKWTAPFPSVQLISRANFTWQPFFVAGRCATALLGTLAALISYGIGKMVFSGKAALAGALCLAVTPVFVQESHRILPNIPSVVLALMSMRYALKAVNRPSPLLIILAGFCAGLAGSVKYDAGMVIVTGIAAVCIALPYIQWARSLSLLGICFVLGFFLGSPAIIFNIPAFLNDIAEVGNLLVPGSLFVPVMRGPEITLRIFYLMREMLGTVPFLIAIVGFSMSLVRITRRRALLAIFTAIHLFVIFQFGRSVSRHFLVLLPVFSLYFGYGFHHMARMVTAIVSKIMRGNTSRLPGAFHARARWSAAFINTLLLGLILFSPCMGSVTIVRDLHKPYTYNIAYLWVMKNIPQGSAILLQTSDPRPYDEGGFSDTLPIDPAVYSITTFKGSVPLPVFKVAGHEYLISCSAGGRAPSALEGLQGSIESVKVFEPEELQAGGPAITVWRIKERDQRIIKRVTIEDLRMTNLSNLPTYWTATEACLWMRDSAVYFDISLGPGTYQLFIEANKRSAKRTNPVMRVEIDGVMATERVVPYLEDVFYDVPFSINREGVYRVSLSLAAGGGTTPDMRPIIYIKQIVCVKQGGLSETFRK